MNAVETTISDKYKPINECPSCFTELGLNIKSANTANRPPIL